MELDKEKFSTLMYALTKTACNHGFIDWLEGWGLTDDDYNKIRDYLKETYGVKTYV